MSRSIAGAAAFGGLRAADGGADAAFDDTNLQKEMSEMTNRSNSINVPEAKDAMDRFKMEAASEVAVLIPYQAAYFDKICSITMYIMNDDPF